MTAELMEFKPVTGLTGVFSATKGGLRCTAITLKTGGLCLYSPVAGIGHKGKASLANIGQVEVLLAPNHYHNKGLAEYVLAFPDAHLLAPSPCHARLQKITGLGFADVSALDLLLPDDMQCVAPAGLKTGEVWITSPDFWLVVDAFAGPAKGDGPAQLLKTFPRYGVADAMAYTRWAADFILRSPPKILVPCHGGILRAPNLPAQLEKLLNGLC